eukprot:TRINITY_DN5322_c0_g1_i1.p3 TRINITY_DN5322_c0_g1~~TRINITY_DN5322_c0_g1_i1.p3  ORF type:complete len:167 (+),score=38.05 TRINITY_DN5322_c0_g1_i1:189-689(+)
MKASIGAMIDSARSDSSDSVAVGDPQVSDFKHKNKARLIPSTGAAWMSSRRTRRSKASKALDSKSLSVAASNTERLPGSCSLFASQPTLPRITLDAKQPDGASDGRNGASDVVDAASAVVNGASDVLLAPDVPGVKRLYDCDTPTADAQQMQRAVAFDAEQLPRLP